MSASTSRPLDLDAMARSFLGLAAIIEARDDEPGEPDALSLTNALMYCEVFAKMVKPEIELLRQIPEYWKYGQTGDSMETALGSDLALTISGIGGGFADRTELDRSIRDQLESQAMRMENIKHNWEHDDGVFRMRAPIRPKELRLVPIEDCSVLGWREGSAIALLDGAWRQAISPTGAHPFDIAFEVKGDFFKAIITPADQSLTDFGQLGDQGRKEFLGELTDALHTFAVKIEAVKIETRYVLVGGGVSEPIGSIGRDRPAPAPTPEPAGISREDDSPSP